MNRPTQEELTKLFDPEGAKNGVLRWAVSRSNRVKVGDEAGTPSRCGRVTYRQVSINGVLYKSHIIIWTIANGRWPHPSMHICHHPNIDGLDNRPENLCEMPQRINRQELRHRVGGTSAYQGVSWNNVKERWEVRITLDKHQINLGHFADELPTARFYDFFALAAFGEWANTNAKVHKWKER